MRGKRGTARRAGLLAALATAILQACTGYAPKAETAKVVASLSERACLVRAMYFESNRSSRDGLMAVGTVVMNRVASPVYPNTICGVVGQPGQFAAAVLTRPLNEKELPPVERAADAVLRGERYAPIGNAMHFQVAGLNIPYRVQYVAMAGGNAFYLKTDRRRGDLAAVRDRSATDGVLLAHQHKGDDTRRSNAEARCDAVALRHFRRGTAEQVVRPDGYRIWRDLACLRGGTRRAIAKPSAGKRKAAEDIVRRRLLTFVWQTHS
jgi:spore germination cell wall hydrolase CwlJ-like protein